MGVADRGHGPHTTLATLARHGPNGPRRRPRGEGGGAHTQRCSIWAGTRIVGCILARWVALKFSTPGQQPHHDHGRIRALKAPKERRLAASACALNGALPWGRSASYVGCDAGMHRWPLGPWATLGPPIYLRTPICPREPKWGGGRMPLCWSTDHPPRPRHPVSQGPRPRQRGRATPRGCGWDRPELLDSLAPF